ncbi:asparagine synthase-related protein [Fibrobacterota bacterium]
MPGFIGIIKEDPEDNLPELQKAQGYLTYHDWYKVSEPFIRSGLALIQIQAKVLASSYQSSHVSGVDAWVDGESYNFKEVQNLVTDSCHSLPGLLSHACGENRLGKVLREIDGEYTALLYDKKNSQLMIITDRHGLRPLYLYAGPGKMIFSSELKAFLAFEDFTPKLLPDAVNCFLELGHLLGDLTWFQNVTLIPPATILKIDISKAIVTEKKKYWGWGRISPQNLPFKAAVQELGQIFKKSVRQRIFPGEKVAVPLSGGLDSRAVLAAIPEESCAGAFTFGKKGCRDVEIAEMVTVQRGVLHKKLEFNEENWIPERFPAIWKTDGMISLLDLHASQFLEDIRKLSPVNLNGYLGDVICGGSYLQEIAYDCRIDEGIAGQYYSRYSCLDEVKDEYYDGCHIDSYLISNRGRRLVNLGIQGSSKTVEQRKPFMSNEIIEFIYSLPDDYRLNGRLYHSALLTVFPGWFEKIPWQKTGIPISQKLTKFHKSWNKLKRVPVKLGWLEDLIEFHDYPKWMSGSGTRSLFQKILDPKTAMYPEFVDDEVITIFFKPDFYYNKKHTGLIGRILTLEVWLQQVFEKKYRDPEFQK